MSYYQSPMGDYKTYGYAGDPGFLSSLWKGVKKVAKVGLGYAFGGAAGAAAQLMGGSGPKLLPPPQAGRGLQTVQGYPVGASLTMPGGMMLSAQGVVPRGPFGTAQGRAAARASNAPDPAYGVPSGYHYAKDGSGRLVRNRRMNVANPRALRRAMRRAQGFEKLARRTINFNKRVRATKRRST